MKDYFGLQFSDISLRVNEMTPNNDKIFEELFVLEHLANSDHNIITWKTIVKQLLIKMIKSFDFHKADYDKINEYFSNFKGDDLFQTRNANDCWLKFLEISKEAIQLYVPIRGKRGEKYLLG